MPLYLVSVNPKVKSIADLSDADRIALPAIKTSIQALTLQMAAEKAFGAGQQYKLDALTVSMGHPDAQAAMLGEKSGINAHFGSAPFMYQELNDPRAHKIFDSYEVMGGPHTFNVVWATTKFHDENPKLVHAFIAALSDAEKILRDEPARAAAIYVEARQVENRRRRSRAHDPFAGKRMDDRAEEHHGLCRFHAPRRCALGAARELEGFVLP